jgi:hypothetical protein
MPTHVKEVQETFGDLTTFIEKEEEILQYHPNMKPGQTGADTSILVTQIRTADGDPHFEVTEEPQQDRRNLSRQAKTESVKKLRMSFSSLMYWNTYSRISIDGWLKAGASKVGASNKSGTSNNSKIREMDADESYSEIEFTSVAEEEEEQLAEEEFSDPEDAGKSTGD